MRRAKKIGIVCVGILMVVFMFLSYSNLFGGETKRDITKISVIGIKRKNSQVEDFKRGIEEAANAKRVDVEYLEIEEDYDTIKEYIDREIKNGSQALIVFSEKEEQILSYLQSEKKKIPLILVNPGGTEEKTIRVWFDVQDMAECLAEKIHQKRQEEEPVVNRILLIREGMNYATLAKSAKMRGEAMALAAAITWAAALPEFAGALQKLLMLAWAYGESLLDVRTLLAKGKVPMLKAETEWKLPLEKLGMLAEVLKECDAGGGNGQSYEDYLSGLLILGKKQQRNLRVLDLIECNRRMEKGGETFRVDALVAQAEASADFELAPVFLRVPAVWMHVRNQGTAYTIKGQYGYGQP